MIVAALFNKVAGPGARPGVCKRGVGIGDGVGDSGLDVVQNAKPLTRVFLDKLRVFNDTLSARFIFWLLAGPLDAVVPFIKLSISQRNRLGLEFRLILDRNFVDIN